jgi:hypothetical protein
MVFGVSLVLISAMVYSSQIMIFRTPRDSFFYLFQDLAFVPIQILLVTLILDQLLRIREKRSMMKKLNMVIGAFYSEVGTALLKLLSVYDMRYEAFHGNLIITGRWNDQDFARVRREMLSFDYHLNSRKKGLDTLSSFLLNKREFLLRLLENPNLLEHESFTDLLWAVFHLTEELSARTDLGKLPEQDHDHLSGDIKRAYILLVIEWLSYMNHLKVDYPYLFSLAVRTNPFNPDSAAEIT